MGREPIAEIEKPEPPKHLSKDIAAWFKSVIEEYQLDEHHVRILICACESWDRMQAARRILDKEGLTYSDKGGYPRKRPEIAIEENSRIAFLRAVRELQLGGDQGEARIPRLGGF